MDADEGQDSNPGTRELPWKHCPGLTGWSGSAALSAGDIVYFDSEDTWTGSGGNSLLEARGGVAYDGRSWRSGERATLRATGSFSRAVVSIRDDHPTIETLVRGFHVDVNDKDTSGVTVNWPSSVDLTGAFKIVEDCVVHDVGTYPAQYGIKVGATRDTETHNVEVLDCTVYNTPRTGIVLYAAVTSGECIIRNATVRGCESYNTGEDPTAGGNGIGVKNHVIDGVVEYNYTHDTSGRGIDVTNTPGIAAPHNAKVRHNVVTRCGKGGVYISQPGDKSVDIYGNLIFKNYDTGSGGSGIYFESDLSGAIEVNIFNNTLFDNANGEILVANSSATFPVFTVKNNILVPRSGKSAISDRGKITAQSSNLTSDPGFKDPSNLPTGFVGTHGVDLRPDNDGLSVKSGPAIDAGEDLGSPYDMAINSVVRPDGAWDIGAYEYGQSDVPECAEGDVEACYEGPAGTEDVGICHDGSRTCSGGVWGDCQNQVLPEAEVCDDGVDQDCNGADLPCDCPDVDGDGYANAACGGDDCNDSDPDVNPGATEVCNDGVDNDCDQLVDAEDDRECEGTDVKGGCGCDVVYRTKRHGGEAGGALYILAGLLYLALRKSGKRSKEIAR